MSILSKPVNHHGVRMWNMAILTWLIVRFLFQGRSVLSQTFCPIQVKLMGRIMAAIVRATELLNVQADPGGECLSGPVQ